MLEMIMSILTIIAKNLIGFCKFFYPILTTAGIIIHDEQRKHLDLLFIGLLFFVISEVVAPMI